MKKILIYSHDTYGLGNIRRMLAIAESIQSQRSDVSILLVSGSPMIHAFRLSPGIDYIKLPCVDRLENEKYEPKALKVSKKCILRLRRDLISNTVVNFEPDLILVDKKPLGIDNELAPMIRRIRNLKKKPKLVLVLRDILDTPCKTIPIWTKHRYHDVIRDAYDRVLILGSTDVFNAVHEYSFPNYTAEKTFFCGYTNRSETRRLPADVREELGIGDRRLVVVTAGGGKDGAHVVRAALQTIERFGRKFADHCLLFLGPEMAEEQAHCYRAWASGLSSVTVKSFSRDFTSYLGAANAAVAMGGYNTVAEILSLAVPAVIIPRTTPVSEQQIRAARLQRLGLVRSVLPDELCPEELLTAVTKAQNDHHSSDSVRYQLDLAALERVARHVDNLLSGDRLAGGPLINGYEPLARKERLHATYAWNDSVLDELAALPAGST